MKKNLFIAAVLIVCTAGSFLVGRQTALPSKESGNWAVRETRERAQSVREHWRAYAKATDGWIASDPYRDMIEKGIVQEYSALADVRFVRFLPPRVNPAIEENAKFPVFSVPVQEGESAWICYADGSLEFHTWEELKRTPDTDWQQKFRALGIPVWQSVQERDAWIAANRDKFTWNAQEKLFFPKGVAKSSGSASDFWHIDSTATTPGSTRPSQPAQTTSPHARSKP